MVIDAKEKAENKAHGAEGVGVEVSLVRTDDQRRPLG